MTLNNIINTEIRKNMYKVRKRIDKTPLFIFFLHKYIADSDFTFYLNYCESGVKDEKESS